MKVNEIPYAIEKQTSYENFVAKCPWCEQKNIFNRVTDLKDFRPITFRTVSCLHETCGKSFHINGDSASSAHQMLILDCYKLLKSKHYMHCVLTTTQAYEVFFSLFLRVELLYKPFAQDEKDNLEEFDRLSSKLADKLQRHTFKKMRALFITTIIDGRQPKNLREAEEEIERLEKNPKTPEATDIEALDDEQLVEKLQALLNTRISDLRNMVVHKQAYRPSMQEAKEALEEARALLFPLTQKLDLYDDINWYMAYIR